MSSQPDLIHQVSSWMHFIGGYYKNEETFVAEAQKSGISRRIPAQVIRGMEFGDRLVFLRYVKGNSFAFAEGIVIGITLEGPIAKQVGEKLIQEGKAEYHQGGGKIERACGSYFVIGTYEVRATLKETMDIAQQLHDQQQKGKSEDEREPLFVMVNATLTQAYANPVYLSPAPKFTRGFIRSDDSSFVAPGDFSPERNIIAIDGYARKDPRKRAHYPELPGVS